MLVWFLVGWSAIRRFRQRQFCADTTTAAAHARPPPTAPFPPPARETPDVDRPFARPAPPLRSRPVEIIFPAIPTLLGNRRQSGLCCPHRAHEFSRRRAPRGWRIRDTCIFDP